MLANREICSDVSFKEPFRPEYVARNYAIFPVRGDECGDCHKGGLVKESGDFRNAPDVFLAMLRRKPQVTAQAMPDVVAIEDVTSIP